MNIDVGSHSETPGAADLLDGGNDRGPRMLVVGHFAFDRLASSYARAFESLACRVVEHDVRKRPESLRFWLRGKLARRLSRSVLWVRRLGSRRWNRECLRRATDTDVVLVVKGDFLMPDTITAMREEGCSVYILHPDDPFPPSTNHRPELLPNALAADGNFVWSRCLQSRLERLGAECSGYLPFAWDPEVFPHVVEGGQVSADVVFVGGWDRHRERWLEPVAERFDLEIWGPEYWGTRTRPRGKVRSCWKGRELRGRDAAQVVAGAAIALNIFREQNLPDGTNMRTFEVPGAGGFLLSHRSEGAVEIYPEGRAGAYFDSMDEMLEKIDYFLTHPEERGAIARRAHEITARRHRYVHRARTMLSKMRVPM